MTIDRVGRQDKVLEAIVMVHLESALPVGSKLISDLLNLSSATIRSTMFELEKAGYVTQPYTSAGRIPTDLGYRRYVDNMMRVSELSQDDIFTRVKSYLSEKKFFEEIIEAISQAISKVTKYTGIALSPDNRFYCDGAYHLLEQPEFMEVGLARNFLRVIEEKEELVGIMTRDLETKGTIIHIGRETRSEKLERCTIITSAYKYKNRTGGNVGVIGPLRMKYEDVIPMVEYLAQITQEALENLPL